MSVCVCVFFSDVSCNVFFHFSLTKVTIFGGKNYIFNIKYVF